VILKVVGSIPTVARHIFHQACPVWIYTQSNISQAWYKINFNFSHQNDQMTNIICKTSQLIPLQPPWPGIFFKLVRCGYTLRVTSQASYSPEYITPTQKKLKILYQLCIQAPPQSSQIMLSVSLSYNLYYQAFTFFINLFIIICQHIWWH
jgi:hypothetical protein